VNSNFRLKETYKRQFTPTTRPTIVPLDNFVLQEVLYAYRNPSKIDTDHAWIDWVFRLRQPDRRHALEFVEDWNGTRIAMAGSTPLIFSTVVGIVWSVKSGDVQTSFTVAGFILTAGTRKFLDFVDRLTSSSLFTVLKEIFWVDFLI